MPPGQPADHAARHATDCATTQRSESTIGHTPFGGASPGQRSLRDAGADGSSCGPGESSAPHRCPPKAERRGTWHQKSSRRLSGQRLLRALLSIGFHLAADIGDFLRVFPARK